MERTVPPKVYEILKKVVEGNIENFTVCVHDPNKKGEGFLGEMFFISLEDKSNGKQLNYVVKQAFSEEKIRNSTPIRDVFLNEIYFYTKLWPEFLKFQKNVSRKYSFVQVPKCYAAISEENCERLLLENLKCQGFQMYDKKIPLSRGMFEYIFKLYGKLHAISFAYNALNPKGFTELVKGMTDTWKLISDTKGFQDGIKNTYKNGLTSLEPEVDSVVIERYKRYIDDGLDIFLSSLKKGKYNAVLHGDCWSNNMMFKYDNSEKLVDVKFLDFQLIRLGSPVCDLSYCLYTGASKETLDHLDDLLQIYHDSLSESLKAYGCDPNKLCSLEGIKREWKTHCQFGATMGLMFWKVKLTYDDGMIDLTDVSNNSEEYIKELSESNYDKKTFKERTRDLILHLYDNDFLYN